MQVYAVGPDAILVHVVGSECRLCSPQVQEYVESVNPGICEV